VPARLIWLILATTAAVVLLAGCGGKSSGAQTDLGGFTLADRTAAQAALDLTNSTNVPPIIVQLTATIGLPKVCRVHFTRPQKAAATLDVVLAWKPVPRSGAAFTWFTFGIAPTGLIPASMKLGITPSAAKLATHYGVAYTRPFEPCQIDALGRVRAVPLTLAGNPATGHARTIPTH
jgi:hypothetical protein